MIVKRRISVDNLLPNMQLGEDILSSEHRILLAEGTRISTRQIDILKQMNIDSVTINRDSSSMTKSKAIREHQKIIASIKEAFKKTVFFKEAPLAEMKQLVESKITPITELPGIIGCLHVLKSKDAYTYKHSVNVSIISGIIGRWMGMMGKELNDLILAGLLHDVGKILIPDDILNKPGALSDREFKIIKNHPGEGYNLLSNLDITEDIKQGILQHHERANGTGYPNGLKEQSKYAGIIAIADIYDAMTTDRPYRSSQTPFKAIETIVDQMFLLDPEITTIFIDHIRDCFVGYTVELSDGTSGEVICMNDRFGYRPLVRVQDDIIDLEKRCDLKIIKIY